MAESYTMKGGDGPESYAKNSTFQKGIIDATKDKIMEAIQDKLDLENPAFDSGKPFKIADLGCSTGPNTFVAIQNIIEAVELKYRSPKVLEFQVFFNDQANNDFNTLFRSMPPPPPKYYAAGVPGSFHGRLFPKDSLHFVHCSYALHWLSKVPAGVQDRNSKAWNKSRIYCSGFETEVAKAYLGQFQSDMETFLSARAKEVVIGGLMAIPIFGLPNGVHLGQAAGGVFYDILGSCLTDVAKMGIVKEESVESFNLPQYVPTIEELEEIIKKNGNFSIERIDILTNPMMDLLYFDVQSSASTLRAVFEGIIKEHFGVEILDPLFNLFSQKLGESSFMFNPQNQKYDIDLFALLKRNTI